MLQVSIIKLQTPYFSFRKRSFENWLQCTAAAKSVLSSGSVMLQWAGPHCKESLVASDIGAMSMPRKWIYMAVLGAFLSVVLFRFFLPSFQLLIIVQFEGCVLSQTGQFGCWDGSFSGGDKPEFPSSLFGDLLRGSWVCVWGGEGGWATIQHSQFGGCLQTPPGGHSQAIYYLCDNHSSWHSTAKRMGDYFIGQQVSNLMFGSVPGLCQCFLVCNQWQLWPSHPM